MNPQTAQRVNTIRKYLEDNNLDAFLLPTADEHLSEYLPDRDQRLQWLSGFHGENAIAVVTREKASIFVDGRFTVQVKQMVPAEIFEYLHKNNDCHLAWTLNNVSAGARIAVDATLHPSTWFQNAEATIAKGGCTLVSLTENPVDLHWGEQPEHMTQPVELFHNSGQDSLEKRQQLAAQLKDKELDASLLTQPEDTNWLLNIRGADIPFVRTTLSYGLLHNDGTVDFFVNTSRLSDNFPLHVGEGVRVHEKSEIANMLKQQSGKRIQLAGAQTNAALYNLLAEAGAEIVEMNSLCALARVCKNENEIEGMKQAHIQDGIAVCRFLAWVDEQVETGADQNECTLADKLQSFREGVQDFIAPSFASISALGPNAAMCHYHHPEEGSRKLGQDGIYLIDSGGHYKGKNGICGTTDITRTLKVGKVTEEMQRMTTLVLKSHIALDVARFMQGTTGAQLDTVTRQPMWQQGVNFDHGTGHGISHMLSVHEFPPRINAKSKDVILPGMCLTDEPGYYREDGFGIRLENVLVVREARGTETPVMEFENITFVPMDKRLFILEMLTLEEKIWLDTYHAKVFEKIAPHLSGSDLEWLKQATSPMVD